MKTSPIKVIRAKKTSPFTNNPPMFRARKPMNLNPLLPQVKKNSSKNPLALHQNPFSRSPAENYSDKVFQT